MMLPAAEIKLIPERDWGDMMYKDLKQGKLDKDARGPSGDPVLSTAVDSHALEVTLVLLDAGAEVNAVDEYGSTPL